MQHRGLGRARGVRMVGVPAFAGNVAAAVGEAILVGDVMDLRAVRDGEARIVLREDLAEQADRLEDLRRRQRLVADHQHAALDEGAVHRGTIQVGNRLREVDPQHLGARVRTQRPDFHGHPRRLSVERGTAWRRRQLSNSRDDVTLLDESLSHPVDRSAHARGAAEMQWTTIQ